MTYQGLEDILGRLGVMNQRILLGSMHELECNGSWSFEGVLARHGEGAKRLQICDGRFGELRSYHDPAAWFSPEWFLRTPSSHLHYAPHSYTVLQANLLKAVYVKRRC